MRLLACGACLAVVLSCAPSTSPEDLANDVSSNVMSPFCPGVTLHDCPSEKATDYRAKIVGWAEEGWSKERIMARIRSDFGPGVNATPPAGGAGILAWILPGIAVLAGGALALLAVRRWTGRRSGPGLEAGPAIPAMAPEERRLIEAELEELRRRS